MPLAADHRRHGGRSRERENSCAPCTRQASSSCRFESWHGAVLGRDMRGGAAVLYTLSLLLLVAFTAVPAAAQTGGTL